ETAGIDAGAAPVKGLPIPGGLLNSGGGGGTNEAESHPGAIRIPARPTATRTTDRIGSVLRGPWSVVVFNSSPSIGSIDANPGRRRARPTLCSLPVPTAHRKDPSII